VLLAEFRRFGSVPGHENHANDPLQALGLDGPNKSLGRRSDLDSKQAGASGEEPRRCKARDEALVGCQGAGGA
jgi:hypothetical protein